MDLAIEGQHAVFAMGKEADVTDDHQIIVAADIRECPRRRQEARHGLTRTSGRMHMRAPGLNAQHAPSIAHMRFAHRAKLGEKRIAEHAYFHGSIIVRTIRIVYIAIQPLPARFCSHPANDFSGWLAANASAWDAALPARRRNRAGYPMCQTAKR